MRRHVPLLLLAACAALPGDVHLVAVQEEPIHAESIRATVSRFLLDDCEGGLTTVLVGVELDLLGAPEPFELPAGYWCGVGVEMEPATAGSLHLSGRTTAGTTFDVALDPGWVMIDQEFFVDGDEWVLVLEPAVLLDADTLDAQGGHVAITPADDEAALLAADLPFSMWFGPVWEARDHVYLDLWPFDDIDWDPGIGRLDLRPGGCHGGGTTRVDRDGDGIFDADDDDADGDGILDVEDPDGGSGGLGSGEGSPGSGDGDSRSGGCSGSGGGGSDDDGSGGGGSSGGGSGGGSSGGCGGGGSSSGGSGCDGGSSSGGSSGGGCDGGSSSSGCSDCGGAECATVGFAPPWAVFLTVFVVRRRRRR